VQTFNQILQGKTINDVNSLPAICKKSEEEEDNKGANLSRSIALVPFIARFDPWLEYLGNIRDIQTPKK